jgi:hypothetical protein
MVKFMLSTLADSKKEIANCFTIINRAAQRNPYYVCEYVSPALYKSIVTLILLINTKKSKQCKK